MKGWREKNSSHFYPIETNSTYPGYSLQHLLNDHIETAIEIQQRPIQYFKQYIATEIINTT